MKTREDYSGSINCSDDSVIYNSAGGDWSVRISEIRLIGEYTTANGPYIDDYFIVFLTATEHGWHEASFYAEGRDRTLQLLEQKIGAPLQTGLHNSANYKTRIIWPPRLKDQELMEVLPQKSQNFLKKLLNSGARDITLSKAAREAFE